MDIMRSAMDREDAPAVAGAREEAEQPEQPCSIRHLAQTPANARVAIYGRGGRGQDVLAHMRETRPDITPLCFVDSHAAGETAGLQVILPEALEAFDPDLILVASHHVEAILANLPLQWRARAAVVTKEAVRAQLHARGEAGRFLTMAVEPSRFCDMQCDFCGHRLMDDRSGCMDEATVEAVVSHLEQHRLADWVEITGMGEPLRHPRILAIVRRLAEAGSKVSLCTNGLMLTPDMLDALINAGASRISISLQTLSEASYGHRRSAGDVSYDAYFTQIMHVVERHQARCHEAPLVLRLMYSEPAWLSTRVWGLQGVQEDTRHAEARFQQILDAFSAVARTHGRLLSVTMHDFREALRTLVDKGYQTELTDCLPGVHIYLTELHLSTPDVMRRLGAPTEFVHHPASTTSCEDMRPLVAYNGEVFPCCTIPLEEKGRRAHRMGSVHDPGGLHGIVTSDRFATLLEQGATHALQRRLCQECRGTYTMTSPL